MFIEKSKSIIKIDTKTPENKSTNDEKIGDKSTSTLMHTLTTPALSYLKISKRFKKRENSKVRIQ